jgi:hypothetical protein
VILNPEYYLDSLNVISTNGVVLRKEPSANSDKIMIIDFLEMIYVLKYSEHKDTIDAITSKWAYTNYKNKNGWVFAGNLKSELSSNEQAVKKFFSSPFLNSSITNINQCNKQTIIKEFGEPISIKTSNVQNNISEKTDNFITLTYDNVFFTIRHMGLDGKDWMIQYVIKDNTFPLKNGIKIGDKLDNLIKHLGFPQYDKDKKCYFYYVSQHFVIANIYVDEKMNIKYFEVNTYLD